MDRASYYQLFQQALDDMKYLSHQLNEDALFAGIEEDGPGGPVVGIDLGTTNSCCAVVKDGKPVVQEVRNRFLYKIVPGVKGLAAVEIEGRKLGLEEVSGMILEELRKMAEEYLKQPVSRAVVTVPAFYNENQLKVERILNEPTAAGEPLSWWTSCP